MKKVSKEKRQKNIPYLSILLLIIIFTVLLITMGIYSNKSKPKIIETKTFGEIPGFSFKYPIFNGWEVKEIKKISDNEYYIKLKFPETINLYSAPIIKIIKDKSPMSDYFGMNKNKNNVYYLFSPEKDSILNFYQQKIKVTIDFSNIPNEEGFSRDTFSKKIIDSFNFEI